MALEPQPNPVARPCVRRRPGETDLTIFTAALPRVGRHCVDSRRQWLRVVREPTGVVALQALPVAREQGR
jgi:hypothetical protein